MDTPDIFPKLDSGIVSGHSITYFSGCPLLLEIGSGLEYTVVVDLYELMTQAKHFRLECSGWLMTPPAPKRGTIDDIRADSAMHIRPCAIRGQQGQR